MNVPDRQGLASSVKLGRHVLPNRAVMAPMTRSRSPGHVPTPLNALYYGQRASAGLIVTEGTAPHPLGLGYIDIPGLFNRQQAAGWARVADAVHDAGGRVFVQLMHVGRVSHPAFLGGEHPLGPSAVKAEGEVFTREGMVPFVTPRAMTESDIQVALDSYADAARLAVGTAGLDGIEIHGANGYLPSQFLAPNANRRDDGWGGDVAGRARFLLEATDRTISAIGGDRVGVRLSPGGRFNDIDDPDWPATLAYVAAELGRRPLAYLHVVQPGQRNGGTGDPDVAGIARQGFAGPLILNNGYDADTAEADILTGRADLVSFGVPFLANPDLPARLRARAELNKPDPATFYGGDERGYTDYPAQVVTAPNWG